MALMVGGECCTGGVKTTLGSEDLLASFVVVVEDDCMLGYGKGPLGLNFKLHPYLRGKKVRLMIGAIIKH
jgi:hypothetical protein